MKKIILVILLLFLCFSISGCFFLNNEIADRKSQREYCSLNDKDGAIFIYGGTDYLILEDTVDKDNLGQWVGYIQKLAVLDQQRTVIELRELSLSDLKSSLPDEAVYVVQFLNIYKNSEDGENLVIGVNGRFHKAVPKILADDAEIISFEELQNKADGEIMINADNCTQILYGGSVYQITETEISDNDLDAYLGVIGSNKVFDSETNLEILRSDLNKIEIKPGKISKQKRVNWSYGTVFSISNTDKSKSIAVEINNQYIRADIV
ncbi:NisI/SpaI family lantibiotic immunity lipoprotein [Anaerovorax odorimutans]|uniref:NisI/SpaI family lantibiotic immunity lipoprotein n=1 Tax=Anaerovorax odorimutans TaxID=109327 RepID=UPI0004232DF8|nr:NisI/SpaI family lantibiotic immunity lipoprotein [Anaerovorax odorimutans]